MSTLVTPGAVSRTASGDTSTFSATATAGVNINAITAVISFTRVTGNATHSEGTRTVAGEKTDAGWTFSFTSFTIVNGNESQYRYSVQFFTNGDLNNAVASVGPFAFPTAS